MSSVERKIEEAALKGKTGLSRYFAKRAVKKHSVANVRTAPAQQVSDVSSTVFSTTSASDALSFASPRPTLGEVDESGEPFGFAVPVLFETLSSTYLRRHFEKNYLRDVLKSNELSLWDALSNFYAKYCGMDDAKLDDAQEEMKKEIEEICKKHHGVLKGASHLRERAKKQKTVFPQFFRSAEVEMYGKHHEAYKKAFLEHKEKASHS